MNHHLFRLKREWEYTVYNQSEFFLPNEISSILNHYGRDGWELVSKDTTRPSGSTMVFKRPKARLTRP